MSLSGSAVLQEIDDASRSGVAQGRAEVESKFAPVVKAAADAKESWYDLGSAYISDDPEAFKAAHAVFSVKMDALESALRELELSEGRSKSK